ncbi:hypothetical protein niasHS_018109 [Heterodera schachtii]|uniref:Uncharacterized protein n=1 Tax=Heterodera schachtii TaxID=97005 RepID=A0ABD2HQC3_HETSC
MNDHTDMAKNLLFIKKRARIRRKRQCFSSPCAELLGSVGVSAFLCFFSCCFLQFSSAQFICSAPPAPQLVIHFSPFPSYAVAPPAFLPAVPPPLPVPFPPPPPPMAFGPPLPLPPPALPPPPILREAPPLIMPPFGPAVPPLPPPPPPAVLPPPLPPPFPPASPFMAPPFPANFYSPLPMPGYTCTIIGLKRRRRNDHRNPYLEKFRDEYGGFTVSYVFDEKRHELEAMDSRRKNDGGNGAVTEVKEYNAKWADEYGIGQDRLPKKMAKTEEEEGEKDKADEEKLVVITVPDKFSPWTLERRKTHHQL